MSKRMQCDVVVMGGGPAGSATGAFLAQAGLSVIVIEGEKHPRHHIGESLLPGSIPILNRLGISSDELARRFQPKFGARFYDPVDNRMEVFGFEATPGSKSPAYQVFREELDQLLAEKSRAAGCTFLEEAVIEGFDEEPGVAAGATKKTENANPTVLLRDGRTIEGRFLVDASGRNALVATKRKWKQTMAQYGRVAIYNYFADLRPHDDKDADYITMYLFEGGWVWLIPLRDGRTSVGIVYRDPPELDSALDAKMERTTRQERLFWQTVKTMPRLQRRLVGGTARVTDPYRAIGDYSYSVERKFGESWAAVGDAGGFLDPIFSSGVHLALSSAERASEGIVEKLRTGSDAGLAAYSRHMDAGFQVFQAFVHRFYNRDLIRNLFFMPNKPPEIHLAITRILAGNVWDETNPVIKMVRNG